MTALPNANPDAKPRRTWRKNAMMPSVPTIALFILPAFVLYTVFMVYPLVQALIFSTFEFNGLVRGDFVGLRDLQPLYR